MKKVERVAVVTGSNRGLGLETCRQLLSRGLRVVMTGRDVEAIERAWRSLGQGSERAIAVHMDVTDVASIEGDRKITDEIALDFDMLSTSILTNLRRDRTLSAEAEVTIAIFNSQCPSTAWPNHLAMALRVPGGVSAFAGEPRSDRDRGTLGSGSGKGDVAP